MNSGSVLAVVFPIIGGIKANTGELWHYPIDYVLRAGGTFREQGGAKGRRRAVRFTVITSVVRRIKSSTQEGWRIETTLEFDVNIRFPWRVIASRFEARHAPDPPPSAA